MKAKHTPGPWIVKCDDSHDHIFTQSLPHRRIACVFSGVIGGNEKDQCNQADARLIAAAPEMYQLIEKCYKVLHMGVWEVDETDENVCSQINDIMCNHFGDDWRPRREQTNEDS